MHKAVLTAATVAVLYGGSTVAAAAPRTWEYAGSAQWQQVNDPAGAAPATQPAGGGAAPVPQLDRVEQMLRVNQNRPAAKAAIRWVVANKTHPQRDRGLFLIAQALYQHGNRVRAFYYLDELLDTYPESKFYGPALEKQYLIADEYLNGYKRRFLKVPAFHAYDEAIEMLYRLQQRAPASQLAERALLRTANFYYNDQQYDFAGDTYAAYLRTYPRSPIVPRVKLRQAYSMYAQFRGPRFDATTAIDAREQLREVIAQYPDLAAEEKLPELVEQIDRNLARKLYVTADFYKRTKQPVGAAYTYRYVAKAYPNTPEGQKAQVAMKELPAWAVQTTPEPAITPGYGPATPDPTPRMLPGRERRTQ